MLFRSFHFSNYPPFVSQATRYGSVPNETTSPNRRAENAEEIAVCADFLFLLRNLAARMHCYAIVSLVVEFCATMKWPFETTAI